jgi:hypothetical protein
MAAAYVVLSPSLYENMNVQCFNSVVIVSCSSSSSRKVIHSLFGTKFILITVLFLCE